MLGALGHHVAMCCDVLSCVGCCWLKFENGQTRQHVATANTSQHFATRWPNAHNMLRPTMLRYVALPCCDRLAGALQLQSRAVLSDPFRGHGFKESSVIGGVIDYFAHAYGCRMINAEATSIERESTSSSSNKWTEILYQDYIIHCIANLCASASVYNWSSKKDIWKYSVEMKLTIRFCIWFAQFLWTFKLILLSSHGFGVISDNRLYLYLLENANRTVILVQGFCPLKLIKFARFPIGFRLNHLKAMKKLVRSFLTVILSLWKDNWSPIRFYVVLSSKEHI